MTEPSPSDLSNFLQENKDDIAEALSADLALSRSAASVLIDHQYSSQSQVQETESNDQELPCTIWTQPETNKKDQATHVARPENAVEDIQNSDDSVQFYTGLPDFDTFKALFETLCEYGMDEIESDQRMKLRLVQVIQFISIQDILQMDYFHETVFVLYCIFTRTKDIAAENSKLFP